MPAIPRRVSALLLLRKETQQSFQQTSTVTASPMLPCLEQSQTGRLCQSFWASETDLSVREWIIQFRRAASREAMYTETARSMTSWSLRLVRAFFWGTATEHSKLTSH